MNVAVCFLLLLSITKTCVAQYSMGDCHFYRQGKFMYTDTLGNEVTVDRKSKKQSEHTEKTGIKTVLKIKWMSDCSYQLTQIWSNSKALRKFNGYITTVIISRTFGADSYEYSCNCEDKAYRDKYKGIMRRQHD